MVSIPSSTSKAQTLTRRLTLPFSRDVTTQGLLYSPQKVHKVYATAAEIFLFSARPGRLYQVEYAIEAINHAGTCLGILASDGVLLAAERKNINKLLDDVVFSEKIYKLDE